MKKAEDGAGGAMRDASPEQAGQIAALAREIWSEHYRNILSSEQIDYMLSRFQSEAAIREGMGKGMRYVFLCADGEPRGYMALRDKPEDNVLFLSKLYLQKAARGRGLGRMAAEFCRREACRAGRRAVRLTVNKQNNSLAVYSRMGFTVTDSVVMDIGGGFVMDDYVMELPVGEMA